MTKMKMRATKTKKTTSNMSKKQLLVLLENRERLRNWVRTEEIPKGFTYWEAVAAELLAHLDGHGVLVDGLLRN